MSYALAIAADADADLRNLDPWLQEETLDELELLLRDPSILPAVPVGGDASYEFFRNSAGIGHHITIVLVRNDASRTLTVLGFFYRQTPIP